ncbi:11-beta-hydroxysteroid dehydrogenase type 2-like [Ptychodera flava]|uniref:11-beta-hydroxysteroid dehydrogenase type 2-like n=1 Tax=Ptychodera flava TaxID=63121 RepID=UPI00396A281E
MSTTYQLIVRGFFLALSGVFLYVIYSSLFPLQPLGDGRYGLNISHVPFTATVCLVFGLGLWLYSIPARLLEIGGKAVLITGCDTGFGHALAVHLDRLGFQVFAGCLFKGGEGEQQLVQTCSDRLTTIQLDITDQEQVDNALAEVERKLDGKALWGLINNAGMLCLAEFELTPMTLTEKLMQVNCIGPMRVTKAFLPLIRSSRGRIVNVTSIAGKVTLGLHASYSASKAAMELFSDGLRMEVAQWGVRVSIIEPAGFRTGLLGEQRLKSMAENVVREASPISKRDYGEDYLEQYQQRMVKIGRNPSRYVLPDLSPVIDAMTDALLSTAPKARYAVGKGIWIMFFVRHCLPTKMADRILYKTFAPKLPLPAGVQKLKKDKAV